MEFKLGFTKVECNECHYGKAISSFCSKCNNKDIAEDPEVVKRQLILIDIFKNIQIKPQTKSDLDFLCLLGEIDNCFNDFLNTLEAFAKDFSLKKELIKSINGIILIYQTVNKANILRPQKNIWFKFEIVVNGILSVAGHYLHALYVSTPDQALKLSEKAQDIIDSIAKELHALSDLFKWLNSVDNAPIEEGLEYEIIAISAYSSASLANNYNFSSKVEEVYFDVTGKRDVPIELLPGLQMTYIQAELYMDSQRFWHIVKKIYSTVVSNNRPFLNQIDNWIIDYQSVARELYDVGNEANAIFSIYKSNKVMGIRSRINMGGKIVERVMPTLLKILYSTIKNEKYNNIKVGAKKIRDLAITEGYYDVIYGFDFALRDADAHNRYSYSKELDKIFFHSERREYDELTYEELEDRVIGSVESSIAIHTGYTIAAVVLGYDIKRLDPLIYVGIPEERSINIILTFMGLENINITFNETAIKIKGFAKNADKKDIFKMLITIVPLLAGEYIDAKLDIKTSSRRYKAIGSLEPIRRWIKSSNFYEKDCNFIEMILDWKINGKNLLSDKEINNWLRHKLKELNEKKSSESKIAFLRLHDIAKRTTSYK